SFTYTVMDAFGITATATVHIHGGGEGVWATRLLEDASGMHGTSSEWSPSGYEWSARQALGPPNTSKANDEVTAWAAEPMNGPTGPDGNIIPGVVTESLAVGFEFGNTPEGSPITGVHAIGALIHESDGNGFVTKVEVHIHGTSLDTFQVAWSRL